MVFSKCRLLNFELVDIFPENSYKVASWCRGVMVITTAQLHSTKAEHRFRAGSNPACGLSKIREGEDF